MPKISRLNPNSETWHHIKSVCDEKILESRERNDSSSLTEVETAVLRGKIKAFKEILDLTKPPPEVVGFDDDTIY